MLFHKILNDHPEQELNKELRINPLKTKFNMHYIDSARTAQ
jgi:hypothetical protein